MTNGSVLYIIINEWPFSVLKLQDLQTSRIKLKNFILLLTISEKQWSNWNKVVTPFHLARKSASDPNKLNWLLETVGPTFTSNF